VIAGGRREEEEEGEKREGEGEKEKEKEERTAQTGGMIVIAHAIMPNTTNGT
jgi:hypothetical protein